MHCLSCYEIDGGSRLLSVHFSLPTKCRLLLASFRGILQLSVLGNFFFRHPQYVFPFSTPAPYCLVVCLGAANETLSARPVANDSTPILAFHRRFFFLQRSFVEDFKIEGCRLITPSSFSKFFFA